MLTEKDRRAIAETAMVPPDRINALQFALRSLAQQAAHHASTLPKDSYLAAALRGRRLAYYEAALMVGHVANGHALHPRRNSPARRRAQEFGRHRAARRAERAA